MAVSEFTVSRVTSDPTVAVGIQVEVSLVGLDHHPADGSAAPAAGESQVVSLTPRATIVDLLRWLELAPQNVSTALVNGRHVALTTPLPPDSAVSLWGPVTGF